MTKTQDRADREEPTVCAPILIHPSRSSAIKLTRRIRTHAKNATAQAPVQIGNPRRLAVDIVYYVLILATVFIILMTNRNTGHIMSFFGYSVFNVMSGSMQREIPQGSLIIVQKVPADTIQIGDAITFLRGDNGTVTHSVIGIYENYDGSATRGFETQGLENPMPDPGIIHEDNVVGVVRLALPEMGFIMSYISENIYLFLLLPCGVWLTAVTARKYLCEEKREQSGSRAG